MQFGASTWLWTSPFDGSDPSLLRRIAEMGFDFVEIPVEDPEAIDGKGIAAALEETGLTAVVCAAVVGDRDLSSAEASVNRAALSYFESCIRLARLWGSPLVVGPLYAPVGKARLRTEAERQAEWARSAKNLRQVAEMASSEGIKLGLEPLNRFETDMVNTAEDALRLVAEADHASIGISLDSFHMNIEEVDFQQAIASAGERLWHLQVSDSHRGVPGEGNSDWQGLRAGLASIGYQGRISIESFSPDSSSLAEAVCIWRRFAESQNIFAEKGLRFLKQWFADPRSSQVDRLNLTTH